MSNILLALRTTVPAVLSVVMLLGLAHLTAADPEAPKKEEPQPEAPKKEDPKKDVTNDDLRKLVEQLREEMDRFRREVERNMAEVRRGGIPTPLPLPPTPRLLRFPQQGRLGVSVDRPGEVLVEHLNLDKNTGLVIIDVVPESPAAKAGLKQNDILVEFGGKAVPNNPPEFARMIEDAKADTPFDVTIIRKGKKETLQGVSLPEVRAPRRPAVLRPVAICR